MPGYGYAAVSKGERAAWGRLIEKYFASRLNLALCVLLLDIRRVPNDDDMRMLDAMASKKVPVIIVLTKADKLSNNEKNKQIKIISETVGKKPDDMILFSALSGLGKDKVWEKIKEIK